MKKRKKLSLSTLKVKSFVTNLNTSQSKFIVGGNSSNRPTDPGKDGCPEG